MRFKMNPTTAPGPANKLLGLEVLRFLAAFAILVFHYRHFAFVADTPVDLVNERLPLYRLLHVFYDHGPYGVWIFWCISGFIFFWKYRDAVAERSVGGWKFFVLRFSRLYPLHIATLLLVALVQPLYFNLHGYFFVYQENDLAHFLPQLAMASNWGFQDALSFDGPIWSISVEVLVYFFFFVMLLATRSWLLNLAVIAACLVASGQVTAACLTSSGQIAACFAFFYAGGLAAMARRAVTPSVYRWMAESVGWLAVIGFPLWAWQYKGHLESMDILLLLLIVTPILLFCLSRDIVMPASLQKFVEAAGNMTYSSYLLHFPIQLMAVVGFAIVGAPIPLYDGGFFGLYIGTTLVASYLIYRYFEAPAQNLIRALLLRPRTAIIAGSTQAFVKQKNPTVDVLYSTLDRPS
jgi:peptidoglycan/LPS O-acetylase OafA/YrhL